MNSNRITRCGAALFAALFVLAPPSPANAEGWGLARWSPTAVASGFALSALAASHAIRDTLPSAIATWGTSSSASTLSTIKATLDKHRIVGPRAAIDTAARVVNSHPDLRPDTLSALQMLGLSLEAFEERLTAVRAGAAAVPDEATEAEERCPPPTPVTESMSARAAAYQRQITGLPPGTAIVIGGVKFDGCRAADGTLLEAKGPGYGQFLVSDIEKRDWYSGDGSIMDQARRQSRAARLENRRIEWHFAEKLASDYYANRFRIDVETNGIVVLYDPPLQ